MVVLIVFVEGPEVLLVELKDGHLDDLCDVDEDRMQLGRVGVLHLSLLFVVNIHLFLRQVDISFP